MKKYLALVLVLVMALGLFAACGTEQPAGTTAPKGTEPAGTTAPAAPTEPQADYSTYYQTFQSDDQGTANYWDDKGNVAGDLHSYFAGSYWGTAMMKM